MNDAYNRSEELRQEGLALIRANRAEESLPVFDRAIEFASDEESRESAVIDKAGALLLLERTGDEVLQLPRIIMRRPSLRLVYKAAYNLHFKFVNEKDYRKAANYVRVALQAAEEAEESEWITEASFALADLEGFESRFPEAIELFERVLEASPDDDAHRFRRSFTLQNLGYYRLMNNEAERGVELIHTAVRLMQQVGAEGYAAESYIDLCFGYLELGRFEEARTWGQLGLDQATETRQVRNAHYLLGEVAYKLGDEVQAEFHFEHLARFYPDFPQLKNLLFALDLRGLINLKL